MKCSISIHSYGWLEDPYQDWLSKNNRQENMDAFQDFLKEVGIYDKDRLKEVIDKAQADYQAKSTINAVGAGI